MLIPLQLYALDVDEVDPFLGVDNNGNVLPGPVRPFGLVRLGPDVVETQNNSGYETGKPILGFSHNHLSGTGGPARYGNICAIPQSGELCLPATGSPIEAEEAKPGYYAVTLTKPGVRAELTSTARSGWHRYTWASGVPRRVLLDLSKGTWSRIKDGRETRAQCDDAQVTVVDEYTLEGISKYSGGWGGDNPYAVHWVAKFREPFIKSAIWNGLPTPPAIRSRNDKYVGVWVEFPPSDKPLVFKVGISYKSLANARQHVEQMPGFDFDAVVKDAREDWQRHLGLIAVKGGAQERRTVLATSLYRTLLVPADLTGDNPGWESSEPHYWDYYAIWDTFRTLMPLHTLIQRDRQVDILRCLLDIHSHTGWVPDVWTAGGPGMVQGGTDVDIAFADAAVKGLPGLDWKRVLAAVRKNGEVEGPELSWLHTKNGRRLTNYLAKGWVDSDVALSISHTLEYAYCDFGIAQVAKAAGDASVAETYLKRSENAWNLFQEDSKFFWGRKRDGTFEANPNYDQVDAKSPSGLRMLYEGNAWNYATYVPQDHAGLIQRHGGAEAFIGFLDRLFSENKFEMGNEPGFLQPYQYVWAGRPDRTATLMRKLTTEYFVSGRCGLPGNEDSGAMSSWFLFGTLGFYPVAGQDLYIISSPQFEESTWDLGRGKHFTVKAPGTSNAKPYVVAATLNGKSLDRAWFTHGEIAEGGVLMLTMGDRPSEWGRKQVPPSQHLGRITP